MYLDASVAVVLYAREPDSERWEAIALAGDGFVSSELLLGEMRSALLAKERARIISAELREMIWARFEDDVASGGVQLVPLDGTIVHEAIEVMTQVHPEVPLRTLDAIHLATHRRIDAGPLLTRDKRMTEAARRLNLPLAGE